MDKIEMWNICHERLCLAADEGDMYKVRFFRRLMDMIVSENIGDLESELAYLTRYVN